MTVTTRPASPDHGPRDVGARLPFRYGAVLAAGLALAPALLTAARAQTVLRLAGTCERLVVDGRDLTASCAGTLTNGVDRGRTRFDFSTRQGETVTFAGNGAQQEATEETDPLQPINAVAAGGAPILAIGACRFSNPEPGRTAIACEASTPDGHTYAGTFVTATGAAPGTPTPR